LSAQVRGELSSGTTELLRGVSAVNPNVVRASGAGWTWLRTVDGGATWHAAIVPGAVDLDFRDSRHGVVAYDPVNGEIVTIYCYCR